jgi:hypothetical protein
VQLVLVCNDDGAASASGGGAMGAAEASCRRLAAQLWLYGGPPSAPGGSGGATITAAGRQRPPPLLHSVWLNFQGDGASNAALGGAFVLLHGPPWLWQRFGPPAGPPPACFGPGSFMQANVGAAAAALAAVAPFVPPGARLLELHAGVGALGLHLAAAAPLAALSAYELSPGCGEPFARAAALLPPGIAAAHATAAAGDVPAAALAAADVILVDPPRKGLEAGLAARLCEGARSRAAAAAASAAPAAAAAASADDAAAAPPAPAQTLIYLSCGFDALARDADELLAGGWALTHAEAFIFFPGSDAVETLAVFTFG